MKFDVSKESNAENYVTFTSHLSILSKANYKNYETIKQYIIGRQVYENNVLGERKNSFFMNYKNRRAVSGFLSSIYGDDVI